MNPVYASPKVSFGKSHYKVLPAGIVPQTYDELVKAIEKRQRTLGQSPCHDRILAQAMRPVIPDEEAGSIRSWPTGGQSSSGSLNSNVAGADSIGRRSDYPDLIHGTSTNPNDSLVFTTRRGLDNLNDDNLHDQTYLTHWLNQNSAAKNILNKGPGFISEAGTENRLSESEQNYLDEIISSRECNETLKRKQEVNYQQQWQNDLGFDIKSTDPDIIGMTKNGSYVSQLIPKNSISKESPISGNHERSHGWKVLQPPFKTANGLGSREVTNGEFHVPDMTTKGFPLYLNPSSIEQSSDNRNSQNNNTNQNRPKCAWKSTSDLLDFQPIPTYLGSPMVNNVTEIFDCPKSYYRQGMDGVNIRPPKFKATIQTKPNVWSPIPYEYKSERLNSRKNMNDNICKLPNQQDCDYRDYSNQKKIPDSTTNYKSKENYCSSTMNINDAKISNDQSKWKDKYEKSRQNFEGANLPPMRAISPLNQTSANKIKYQAPLLEYVDEEVKKNLHVIYRSDNESKNVKKETIHYLDTRQASKDIKDEYQDQGISSNFPTIQSSTITLLRNKRESTIKDNSKDGSCSNQYRQNSNSQAKIYQYPIESKTAPVLKRTIEPESESSLRRTVSRPIIYEEGIGPISEYGIPIATKPAIRQDKQHDWYKTIFKNLNPSTSRDSMHEKTAKFTQYDQDEKYFSEGEIAYRRKTDQGIRKKLFDQNCYYDNGPNHRSLHQERVRIPLQNGEREYFRYRHYPTRVESPSQIEPVLPVRTVYYGDEGRTRGWKETGHDGFNGTAAQQQERIRHEGPSSPCDSTKAIPKSKTFPGPRTLDDLNDIESVVQNGSNHNHWATVKSDIPVDRVKTLATNGSSVHEWYSNVQKGGDVPYAGLQKIHKADCRKSSQTVTPNPQHMRSTSELYNSKSGFKPSNHLNGQSPPNSLTGRYDGENYNSYDRRNKMDDWIEHEKMRKSRDELKKLEDRRHGYVPSSNSPIPVNRYMNLVYTTGPPDDVSKVSEKHQILTESHGSDRSERRENGRRYSLSGPTRPGPVIRAKARALYRFVAKNSKEISFDKDDILYLLRRIDPNWFEGEHVGMIGIFPANYVKVMISIEEAALLNAQHGNGVAIAKYNCNSQYPSELTFRKGEVLNLVAELDRNWYEGHIGEKGSIGLIPKSYLDILREPAKENSYADHKYTNGGRIGNGMRSLSVSESKKPNQIKTAKLTRYRALYAYKPQNDDEIELTQGDIVYVVQKCEDGWFVGYQSKSKAFGTFPGNYVTPDLGFVP